MPYIAGSFPSGQPTASFINAEFQKIEAALPEYVSRVSTTGNSMEEALDMNDHEILNIAEATSPSSAVTLSQVESMLGTGVDVSAVVGRVDDLETDQVTQDNRLTALEAVAQSYEADEVSVVYDPIADVFNTQSSQISINTMADVTVGDYITLRWNPIDTSTTDDLDSPRLMFTAGGNPYEYDLFGADGAVLNPGDFDAGDTSQFTVLQVAVSGGTPGRARQVARESVVRRLSALETENANLQTAVNAATAQAGMNTLDIIGLGNDINANTTSINGHDVRITALESASTSQSGSLTALIAQSNQNTTDIATNTAGIQSNDTDITALQADVAALQAAAGGSGTGVADSQELSILWNTGTQQFDSASNVAADTTVSLTQVGNDVTLRWNQIDTSDSTVFNTLLVPTVDLRLVVGADTFRWNLRTADNTPLDEGVFEPGDSTDFKVIVAAVANGATGVLRQVARTSVTDRLLEVESDVADIDDLQGDTMLWIDALRSKSIPFSFSGVLPDNTDVAWYTAVDEFTISATSGNQANGDNRGSTDTPVTVGTGVFEVKLNGVAQGLVVFQTNNAVPVFNFASAFSAAPGDVISISTLGQNGLANASITLKGLLDPPPGV